MKSTKSEMDICNCIIVDDETMSRKAVVKLIEKTDFLQLIDECDSATKALNILANNKIDLIFLDVEMPEMTGLEMLGALNNHEHQVIVVSSNRDYALDAFEFSVADYLLKPVTPSRFHKSVQKVKAKIDKIKQSGAQAAQSVSDHLFVKDKGQLVRLGLTEILWIEALGDYVQIYTPGKRYTVNTTMKSIVSRLPEQEFMRVHRSFIVRLDRISSIEDNTIVAGDKLIPVGKSYRSSLSTRLNLI
ncbi:MAG: LytTR family DNA-binding domain-containing protein [Bacteroidota bacterium]